MFKLFVFGMVVALLYAVWRNRTRTGSYENGPTIDVEPFESDRLGDGGDGGDGGGDGGGGD